MERHQVIRSSAATHRTSAVTKPPYSLSTTSICRMETMTKTTTETPQQSCRSLYEPATSSGERTTRILTGATGLAVMGGNVNPPAPPTG
ncbi:MAG: hypothetical protein LBB54_07465, partial [Cellulomonadaceae bacterium]|nr:hypothetical protein [Cellulomonadaceae bacterium]